MYCQKLINAQLRTGAMKGVVKVSGPRPSPPLPNPVNILVDQNVRQQVRQQTAHNDTKTFIRIWGVEERTDEIF